MISLGVLVGAILTEKQILKRNMSRDIFWDGLFIAVVAGVLGARVYHVIDYWDYYQLHLLEIFYVWNGGLGIFGGIILATISIGAFLKLKNQNTLEWLDLAVLYLPLGQVIGRLGNHFNKELLPFAYYEMALNLLLFFVLTMLNRRQQPDTAGRNFGVYILGYALIRLILEPIRQEHWLINQVNVTQGLSLVLIIGILIAYALHCLRSRWIQSQR